MTCGYGAWRVRRGNRCGGWQDREAEFVNATEWGACVACTLPVLLQPHDEMRGSPAPREHARLGECVSLVLGGESIPGLAELPELCVHGGLERRVVSDELLVHEGLHRPCRDVSSGAYGRAAAVVVRGPRGEAPRDLPLAHRGGHRLAARHARPTDACFLAQQTSSGRGAASPCTRSKISRPGPLRPKGTELRSWSPKRGS